MILGLFFKLWEGRPLTITNHSSHVIWPWQIWLCIQTWITLDQATVNQPYGLGLTVYSTHLYHFISTKIMNLNKFHPFISIKLDKFGRSWIPLLYYNIYAMNPLATPARPVDPFIHHPMSRAGCNEARSFAVAVARMCTEWRGAGGRTWWVGTWILQCEAPQL